MSDHRDEFHCGEKVIGFEDQTEETIDPVTEIESGPILEDPIGAHEHVEDDYGDVPELVGEDDVDEVNEAIRVIEEADLQGNFEEEQREEGVHTRARVDPGRFQNEVEADRYAEYVAMGWREPEPQDIGKVVFNRNHRRTEANLIRARQILRESYLERHGGGESYLERH